MKTSKASPWRFLKPEVIEAEQELDRVSFENYEYFRKYCHPKFIDRHLFNEGEETEKLRQDLVKHTKIILKENQKLNYAFVTNRGIMENWFSGFYEQHLPGKNIDRLYNYFKDTQMNILYTNEHIIYNLSIANINLFSEAGFERVKMLFKKGNFSDGHAKRCRTASFILCPIEKLALSFSAERDRTVSLIGSYYDDNKISRTRDGRAFHLEKLVIRQSGKIPSHFPQPPNTFLQNQ